MEEDVVGGIRVRFSPWDVKMDVIAKPVWWVAIFGIPLHAQDSSVIDQIMNSIGIMKDTACAKHCQEDLQVELVVFEADDILVPCILEIDGSSYCLSMVKVGTFHEGVILLNEEGANWVLQLQI